MLRFINQNNDIILIRSSDFNDIGSLYITICGKWLLNRVSAGTNSNELRQIADKLDELNKENK